MTITLRPDIRTSFIMEYETYHVIYETTANLSDKTHASERMILLRKALEISHNEILALADQLP